MPVNLHPLFGNLPAALRVHGQRLDTLASNMANADTPGFKARDVDFRAALSGVQAGLAPRRTDAAHLGGGGEGPARLVWRVPHQPSADGNTVDTQVEQAKFAEAALRYEATLRFMDGRVRSLVSAITGD